MTKEKLLHLSAVAAIVGGGLRIVDAFLSNAHGYVQVAYFVTDVTLIFGLCGIYLSHSNRLGLTGLIGFASAITGLLIVRSFGQEVYLVGATVTVLGMVVLSIVMLASRAFPKSAPLLWIASLIVGVIGLIPFLGSSGVTLAGTQHPRSLISLMRASIRLPKASSVTSASALKLYRGCLLRSAT